MKTKNIAAVTVNATLPPFSRVASKLAINVSTIGDAKSLKGGTLFATPLLGTDGEVYALAQGAISIGIKVANKTTATNPTFKYVNNGAIIEKKIDFELNKFKTINLALKNPDITTTRSIEIVVNAALKEKIATAKDQTVNIVVAHRYKHNVMGRLADIENITVFPDTVAKIVIDEATGTVVIGQNVTINKVTIAQGNMVVKVSEDASFISQLTGAPLTKSLQPGKEISIMKEPAKLSDLVKGLNSLSLKPIDLVAILKSIKQADALQAEIETR